MKVLCKDGDSKSYWKEFIKADIGYKCKVCGETIIGKIFVTIGDLKAHTCKARVKELEK